MHVLPACTVNAVWCNKIVNTFVFYLLLRVWSAKIRRPPNLAPWLTLLMPQGRYRKSGISGISVGYTIYTKCHGLRCYGMSILNRGKNSISEQIVYRKDLVWQKSINKWLNSKNFLFLKHYWYKLYYFVHKYVISVILLQ